MISSLWSKLELSGCTFPQWNRFLYFQYNVCSFSLHMDEETEMYLNIFKTLLKPKGACEPMGQNSAQRISTPIGPNGPMDPPTGPGTTWPTGPNEFYPQSGPGRPMGSQGPSHGLRGGPWVPKGPSSAYRGVPWIPKGPPRVLRGGPMGPQGPPLGPPPLGSHGTPPWAPPGVPGGPQRKRKKDFLSNNGVTTA